MAKNRDLLREITEDSEVFQNFMNDSEKVFGDQIMWPSMLTPEISFSLDWKGISTKLEAVPMATVIDYESGKPVTKTQEQQIMSGELETMGNTRQMDKRAVLRYNNILSSPIVMDPQQIVKAFFGDINDAVVGPNKRIDFMLLQSISKGTMTIDKSNNPNGKPSHAIDWQIPSTGVATTWDNAAATPLTDLENAIQTMEDKGVMITEVIMNQQTFRQFVNTNQVKQAFGIRITNGSKTVTQQGQANISLNDINTYVKDQYGYTIVVNKSLFKADQGEDSIRGFADNRVTLKPDGMVGDMAYMIPLEYGAQDADWSYAFSNYVMVKKQDKEGQKITKNEMTAFPVISNAQNMYILKTDEAI